MISHKYKCIFIHIPKTAGSSVEKKLGLFDELSWGKQDHRTIRDIRPLTLPLMLNFLFTPIKTHEKYSAIKSFLRIGRQENPRLSEELFTSYLKFSIVRNPWARVYSWYKNVMRDPRHGIPPCNFRTFLEKHGDNWALRPQTYWLTDYDNKVIMDSIIKFEDIEPGITKVFKGLGFEDTSLPHLLDSSEDSAGGQTFPEVYDSYTRGIVADRYKREIELFDYRF